MLVSRFVCALLATTSCRFLRSAPRCLLLANTTCPCCIPLRNSRTRNLDTYCTRYCREQYSLADENDFFSPRPFDNWLDMGLTIKHNLIPE